MNRYPLWKYILILAIVAVSLLYALPNLYGKDPALQVSLSDWLYRGPSRILPAG